MARRARSLHHGSDWKDGNKNIVFHRDHHVSPNRRKRTKLLSTPKRWSRGNKNAQDWRRRIHTEAMRMRLAEKWQRDNPNKKKHENPFKNTTPPFKTNTFAEAFKAAGIHVE